MASRHSINPPSRPDQARPEPGQILIVIHDFSARSSDELSLSKGDRVELIERDDDFGDGWYLGRHLTNGQSGLFPEVYTRIAPNGPPSYPPTSPTIQKPQLEPGISDVQQEPPNLSASLAVETSPASIDSRISAPAQETAQETTQSDRTPHVAELSQHTNSTKVLDPSPISPLTTDLLEVEKTPKIAQTSIPPTSIPASLSMTSAAKSHTNGQDSPVMNETLSVIDEHITDMNSPHHSVVAERRGNDSGSEYSSHIEHRLSYINGEETDEEEEGQEHTREEVMTWNPDQVAEYLFTAGVEPAHCEVFRDQEIAGDVLLGMDQTSVFLKEFDLGSVGRRLKTWQKIKALQDDVGDTGSRRNTATYGSEISVDDAGRNRSRSEASNSMFPTRLPGGVDRPGSRQNGRLSQPQNLARNGTLKASPVSPKSIQESPRPTESRPSAASIRDLHHSRQSSGTEFSAVSLMGAVAGNIAASPGLPLSEGHKKQPSFDRNWTMGTASSPPLSTPLPSRPLSSSGLQSSISRSSTDQLSKITTPSTGFDSLDRGYFSGGEMEGKSRNVLRKRTTSQGTHSRNSSYTDDQRMRGSRHSRFGSVDSVHAPPPSASQKYHGLSAKGRHRTPSESSINANAKTPPRPAPPPKDLMTSLTSPTVTKLNNMYENAASPTSRPLHAPDWLYSAKPAEKSRQFGLRAISDAVTGHEKSKVASPPEPLQSPVKESPLQSPSTRTGSTTPSGGPSFELDGPDLKSSPMVMPPTPRAAKKKSKKETSAYTRGLEKKSPREQMEGADYSGWMKKKSSNLMTTWKPRLFILKGRRLSYYYSEDDTEEKGLIDISFHKVLAANNEVLAGLHATLTGAQNSPTSPNSAHTETMASKQAAGKANSGLAKGDDQMFIFKLLPPRAGLSRAVTFTKQTVHYFAVPNLEQGRLWMAALMKATIERDDTKPLISTYAQKTISLAKARAMRHRPPALMNLDEHVDEEAMKTPASDKNGLNISGIVYDRDPRDGHGENYDSGISGFSRSDNSKVESAGLINGNVGFISPLVEPKTA